MSIGLSRFKHLKENQEEIETASNEESEFTKVHGDTEKEETALEIPVEKTKEVTPETPMEAYLRAKSEKFNKDLKEYKQKKKQEEKTEEQQEENQEEYAFKDTEEESPSEPCNTVLYSFLELVGTILCSLLKLIFNILGYGLLFLLSIVPPFCFFMPRGESSSAYSGSCCSTYSSRTDDSEQKPKQNLPITETLEIVYAYEVTANSTNWEGQIIRSNGQNLRKGGIIPGTLVNYSSKSITVRRGNNHVIYKVVNNYLAPCRSFPVR